MLNLLAMLVIGFLVGAVARLLMPGRDPGGCLVTIALGMGGALMAGFIGRQLGLYEFGQAPGFIASVLGAILILVIYRLLVPRRP